MNEDEFRKAFIARRAAQRPVENRRVQMAVLETAAANGRRFASIEFAKAALKIGLPIATIVTISQLSEEEIILLSQGKPLDEDVDN